MTTPFAGSSDALTAALAALLLPAVNTALASEIGEDEWRPVRTIYQMPIPRALVPTLELPALAIYRAGSAPYEVGRTFRWRTEIRADYVFAMTPMDDLAEVWPALHRVHQACIEQIFADFEADGLLVDAGVATIEEDAFRVQYGFSTDRGGHNVFPMFSATWPMVHEPRAITPDETVLPPLSMRSAFKLTDADDPPTTLDLEDGEPLLLEDGGAVLLEEGTAPKTIAETENES